MLSLFMAGVRLQPGCCIDLVLFSLATVQGHYHATFEAVLVTLVVFS